MDMVEEINQTTITVKDKVEFLTKVYDRMAAVRLALLCVFDDGADVEAKLGRPRFAVLSHLLNDRIIPHGRHL